MSIKNAIDVNYRAAVEGLTEQILINGDAWHEHIVGLPICNQVTYTVVVLHQQVINGGFHQYFFNAYGQFAYLTVKHLRLINAMQTACLLEKVVDQINIEKWNINEFRRKVFQREISRLNDFEENLTYLLETFDNEYDSLDEDLEELLGKYLENHNC